MDYSYTRRSDGVTFVHSCTRRVHQGLSANKISRELHENEDFEGKNAIIYLTEDKQVTSLVTHETGFALGESVLQHLQNTANITQFSNIVFCEAIGDSSREALLVIIVEGRVVFDGLVVNEKISELAINILEFNQEEFNLVVYGDVPIGSEGENRWDANSALNLEKNKIISFFEADCSILEEIIPDERFSFVDIDDALIRANIPSSTAKMTAVIAASLVALCLMFWPEEPVKEISLAPQIIDNYKGYRKGLVSPYPDQEFMAAMSELDAVRYLDGIYINKAVYSNGTLTIIFVLSEEVASDTLSFLDDSGWITSVTTSAIEARKNIPVTLRPEPESIYDSKYVIAGIVDDATYGGQLIEVGPPQATSFYRMNTLKIEYASNGAADKYMGLILKNRPLVFENFNIEFGEDVVTNTVTVTVYGKG